MFIGSKKIKEIKDTLVIFEDLTQKKYTKKSLQYSVSEKAVDPSFLQSISSREIAKDMIQVLLEHDLRILDLQFVMNIVKGNIEKQQDKSLCKALGLYNEIVKELDYLKLEGEERNIKELDLIDLTIRDIRMSNYKN